MKGVWSVGETKGIKREREDLYIVETYLPIEDGENIITISWVIVGMIDKYGYGMSHSKDWTMIYQEDLGMSCPWVK